jgi:hypothetical protein
MNILTVENDIITALQSALPDLKVEGFPDNPVQYRLLHPKGAVLVRFQEAVCAAAKEAAFVQQEVTMMFNLTVKIRGLRDKNGAYSYIERVFAALTGFSPSGCGKMYPVNTVFLRETSGIWEYSLNFAVPAENLG